MTVRVVLAAVVAVALLAAAQPAVNHATQTQDAATLRANADRVADAVTALHRRSDPGRRLATAPRRTVSLAVPGDARLAARSDPPRLVYWLAGNPVHKRSLPVRVVVCGGEPIQGRVTLAYVRSHGEPVVVALRGFIRGDGTTSRHACAPSTLPAE